jgi:hypothetical protein
MRKRVLLGALIVILVGGAVAWRSLHVSDLAHIGVGYTAQQTCACLFVSKRSLESCQAELDPMARKLVSLKPGAQEVTARSLGLAHATARYQPGFGCSLQD